MAVLSQVAVMMILILAGMLCYRLRLLPKEVNKSLSNLVLLVASPAVILVSYQKPFDAALLAGLGWSFLLAAICFAAAVLLPVLLLRGGRSREALAVERFSATYSNCAFMGVPLIQGVYGQEGVFYLTAFLTCFNLLVWTHGVMVMKGEMTRSSALKVLRSPAILATVLGFVLFLCNVTIPAVPMQALTAVANLNTPLAMFVAGATIAQTNLLAALKKPRIYYLCFLKLLVIPGVCMAILRLLPVDSMAAGVNLLAVACPTAATGTLFAIEYGKDSGYASEIFALTTLFSLATLPLVMAVWAI